MRHAAARNCDAQHHGFAFVARAPVRVDGQPFDHDVGAFVLVREKNRVKAGVARAACEVDDRRRMFHAITVRDETRLDSWRDVFVARLRDDQMRRVNAQRTALNDQIAFVFITFARTPAAAQNVIAARRKAARTLSGRAALFAARRRVKPRFVAIKFMPLCEQRQVIRAISIAQRRNFAIGFVRVKRDVQRLAHLHVKGCGQFDVIELGEARDIKKVAQGQVVIIGREFAMHSVGQQIALRVVREFLNREREPFGGFVEFGKGDGNKKQCPEFERAMVARGRQVRALVRRLLMQRMQEASVKRGRYARRPIV